MKIAVLSDSHNCADFGRFLSLCEQCDITVHCGDGDRDKEDLHSVFRGKIYTVRGNCDYFGENEVVFYADNLKVLALHGHTFGVKTGLGALRSYAEKIGADIVLYGHSHIPSADWIDGRLFVNSGSVGKPKNGYKPTYCIINIKDGKIYPEFKEIT